MTTSLLSEGAGVHSSVFNSYGLAWSTTGGSVSMLHLIVRGLHPRREPNMTGITTQVLMVAQGLYH